MRDPTVLRGGKIVPASAEDIAQAEADHAAWEADAPRRALLEEVDRLERRKAELLTTSGALRTQRDNLAAEVARLEATAKGGA